MGGRACPDEPAYLKLRFQRQNKKSPLSFQRQRARRGTRIRTWDPLVPNQVRYPDYMLLRRIASGQAGLSPCKKILGIFFTNVFLAPLLFEMKFELPGRFYAFEWSGKYILPRSSA